MGKTHQEQVQLKAELTEASAKVERGAQYIHYKSSDKVYTVLDLAFKEDNNELCVIYRADYGEKLTFIRPMSSWLDQINIDGNTIARFTKIST